MERCLSALEIWASKQGKVVDKLNADMTVIKESLSNMKEIKELLQELKKSKKLSEGGEYLINDEEKKEERYLHSTRSDENGEELLRPCVKTVELPMFEGNDSSRLVFFFFCYDRQMLVVSITLVFVLVRGVELKTSSTLPSLSPIQPYNSSRLVSQQIKH